MAMPISYSYAAPTGEQPAPASTPPWYQNYRHTGFFKQVQNLQNQNRQQVSGQTGLEAPPVIGDTMRQALLAQQAARAGRFADQAEQGYAAYGQQAQTALDALRRQASGQDSVSQMQLRQALQQQLAQQRSLAAGASPRSAAGAARTAAIQMGRANTAAAGQAAIAGQQERNQAATQYGSLIGSLRGQDLSAALGRSNAMSGYGAANTGAPQPGLVQQYGPAVAAAIAAFASDRALKTDIAPGYDAANAAMDKLRPYTFAYKDGKRFGEGEYMGPMAQDLELAGSRAVFDSKDGKMVNGARLAAENTGMIAALNRRVQALEGQPGQPGQAGQSGPGPTVARLGPRPGETPEAALASAFGADPNARAESMANWARTVGMDPAQVARDTQLQQHLARRVNDYKAASPQERFGLAQIWGASQKLDDEQRARSGRTPPSGAR